MVDCQDDTRELRIYYREADRDVVGWDVALWDHYDSHDTLAEAEDAATAIRALTMEELPQKLWCPRMRSDSGGWMWRDFPAETKE